LNFGVESKKKSGFTLIEVIVVIAILAILGAILVPNVLGYRQRAEKSNIQTSAKTIVSSIGTYNADKDNTVDEIADSTGSITYKVGITDLAGQNLLDQSKVPSCLDGTHEVTSVAQLQKVADGEFSVANMNGTASTITINP
jgi:prepilin-type N-terminal cleavage/methylation domain-containing protein